jgi:hypothetical protein
MSDEPDTETQDFFILLEKTFFEEGENFFNKGKENSTLIAFALPVVVDFL